MTAVLSLHDLVIDIPGRADGRALSLSVNAGERWGILGPNGVGKTTLLMTMAGLRTARQGGIRLGDDELATLSRAAIARRVGVVFQQHHDGFPATVLETALIGRHPHLRAWAMEGADDHARALTALERVDLLHLRHRSVQTLSGGERQRLAFATLLTQAPTVFLLDEPTNHLDLHHQIALLELVLAETGQGHGAVMAMHDLNLAARYCSHVLLLYPEGDACWGTTAEMLSLTALERLYNHPLAAGMVDGLPVFLPCSRQASFDL
jgi:iron complex transport system ATP-binding protein